MADSHKSVIIVMADNDPEDYLMAQKALAAININHRLDIVPDGIALMAYLRRTPPYESLKESPLPRLILLDLNIPNKNGLEALQEIKQDQRLRRIPVIILAGSDQEEVVSTSYDYGANSFIMKSTAVHGLVHIIEEIGKYWLEIVELPPESLAHTKN